MHLTLVHAQKLRAQTNKGTRAVQAQYRTFCSFLVHFWISVKNRLLYRKHDIKLSKYASFCQIFGKMKHNNSHSRVFTYILPPPTRFVSGSNSNYVGARYASSRRMSQVLSFEVIIQYQCDSHCEVIPRREWLKKDVVRYGECCSFCRLLRYPIDCWPVCTRYVDTYNGGFWVLRIYQDDLWPSQHAAIINLSVVVLWMSLRRVGFKMSPKDLQSTFQCQNTPSPKLNSILPSHAI